MNSGQAFAQDKSCAMRQSSRLSGFYRQSITERQALISERYDLTQAEIAALTGGGLTPDLADRLIENVVGVYGFPLGIAANFQINRHDYLIPMAIEEPSVVAACSHAAKLVREAGGFTASADVPLMIGQVQVMDVPNPDGAREKILAARADILALANSTTTLVERGGGAQEIEVRLFRETRVGPMVVVHLLFDTRDAMGANAINTACETIAPLLEQLTGGRVVLRILSNLADRRLARAECRVACDALGGEVVRGIVEAQALAEIDPYRAATHNKGILNGIDAVAIATGNDWRSIEAGAHAYAARDGRYGALTRWGHDVNGDLAGSIELPLAVGIVGGTTAAHPVAQIVLKILGAASAQELAGVMAAVGLAQNLGALRALASEGIQQGHLALHARQIAIAAGAAGDAIDRIAEKLVEEKNVRLRRAKELLQR
jgi:hydroxymethylglutaryl-CoA reductase